MRKDTLTTDFAGHTREEGLDISGLLDSAREDIEEARGELTKAASSRYTTEDYRKSLQAKLEGFQQELSILEKNSVPYTGAFPNALDVNNPENWARIAEEARRVWKNPLTASSEKDENNRKAADWVAARARLAKSRLLILPKKETEKPIVAEPTLINVPASVSTEETTTPSVVLVTGGLPQSEESSVVDTGAGSETATAEVLPNGSGIDDGGYKSRIGEIFHNLRESGSADAAAIADRIRGLREELRGRLDPATAKRVDRLLRVGCLAPFAFAALLALAALVGGIPNDTFNNVRASDTGKGSGTPVAEINPEPTFTPSVVGTSESVVTPITEGTPVPARIVESTPTAAPIAPIPGATSAPITAPINEQSDFGKRGTSKPEEFGNKVMIEAGQTVRGIIEKELRKTDPGASSEKVDLAASIALLKIADDNNMSDPDLVYPGDQIILPASLGRFMRGLNSIDPTTESVVHILNNIPQEPNKPIEESVFKKAKDIAQNEYLRIVSNAGE